MSEDAIIHARVDAIFERMATPIFWQDRRAGVVKKELSGYLMRGKDGDASCEIRFRSTVAGLAEGAILSIPDAGRWCVIRIVEEELGGQVLFSAAQVRRLDPRHEEGGEALGGLIHALRETLTASVLPPLERDDVEEALTRIAVLCRDPSEPGHGLRIKQRLPLLRLLQQCPQVGHDARGLILRLEAALKRQGLP